MIETIPYRAELAEKWNAAVHGSRNGTFLFNRGFMDYHADRFEDASLIFMRKGAVLALLPQSRHGDEWRSHGGLTYGGLVLADEADMADMMEIHALIAERAVAQAITRQRVALVPHIYHRAPCEEERYALHRAGARQTGCDVDSVIALGQPLAMATMRARAIRKARRHELVVEKACPIAEFHTMLTDNLVRRHAAAPIHSAQEMALLQGRFPARIACWGARDPTGALLAGIWLFDTGRCAHAQYIASTEEGRAKGAVDLIFAEAIAYFTGRATFFSFGISNDRAGAGDYGLNEGLIRQKTSFGARAIVYETFERSFTQETPDVG